MPMIQPTITYVIQGNPIFKNMRTDVVNQRGQTLYHRSRDITLGSVQDRMKNEQGQVLWEMHKPMLSWSMNIKSQVFNTEITLHLYGILKIGYDFTLNGQRYKIKKLSALFGQDFHLINAASQEPLFTFEWAYLSMGKRGDLHMFPEAMQRYGVEESFLCALALVYLDILEDNRN
ncbi:hypothetical protein BC936DRAFT_149030 [Jimgerdemannia flammicorona]|uniref:Uncharacterized protein n=2 Tax=Jimgerdemannia flammicorona TaxID=994334 RepID=A0A433QQ74_9FUNG|nr:hypothetical protein BC936DRAFT_149030 [Jimgerdemannia flammicorona]RUS31897.1 hypothetical protein BC938DRAFT_476809 [Jimgerdemannia flammicorona]